MALAVFLLEVYSSQSVSRQRVFRDRLNPLDVYNDVEFLSKRIIYIFFQNFRFVIQGKYIIDKMA